MVIGGKEFDIKNKKYIMGILNATPDSFSDGGKYNNISAALSHAQKMTDEGADIIDIGGESTRPGYTQITAEEEIERIVPVIEAVKKNIDIPVSVDTYKSKVAFAAIQAGADLINDIWGLKYDEHMAKIIADNKVACCLMHNRKTPVYEDFISDMADDLKASVSIALKNGISKDKIMLDPGIGFAKSYEQNLLVMNNLERIVQIGYPVLLGTSKKSMIGITLDTAADDRIIGTAATTVIGAMKGCAFYRVHNCRENKQALMMADAICKAGNE